MSASRLASEATRDTFFTCLPARLPPVIRQAELGTGQTQREPRTKGWHGSIREAYLFHTISPAPMLTDRQPPTSPCGALSSSDTVCMQLGECQGSASPTCCLRNKQRDIVLFSFLLSFSFSFFLLFAPWVMCCVPSLKVGGKRGVKKRKESEMRIARLRNIFWD